MEIIECKLPDVRLIKPRVFGDERGFFSETYRRNVYEAAGIAGEFIQDNHSRSGRNIARGMHFQIGRGAAKLVRCGRGAIYDVVVDIRRGSRLQRGGQRLRSSARRYTGTRLAAMYGQSSVRVRCSALAPILSRRSGSLARRRIESAIASGSSGETSSAQVASV